MKTLTTFHVWDCVSGVSGSLAQLGDRGRRWGYLGHEGGSAPRRGEHTKPTLLSLPSSVRDQSLTAPEIASPLAHSFQQRGVTSQFNSDDLKTASVLRMKCRHAQLLHASVTESQGLVSLRTFCGNL